MSSSPVFLPLFCLSRYEEYMDKYHPGLGDERWPLVTHFVGCKPCGKVDAAHLQEVKACVEAMER